MGHGTYVKAKRATKTAGPARIIRLGFDLPLFVITFTLILFGLVMLYSASWDFSLAVYDSPSEIFSRQIRWLGFGTAIAAVLALVDYHIWRRLAVLAMLGTIGLLIGVLIINEVRLGAARSLLAGSYQPSELAKIVTVIYLSVWLFAKHDQIGDVNFGLIPLAGILGVVGGLIFLQPDLSAVVTVVFLGALLFFLAGGDLKQIATLALVTIIVGAIVVRISPTGSERVDDFVKALSDPTLASYHLLRSFEAFAKGGWLGVGIGRADTKLTGLPVPPTDSIFAVVGEETGVVGAGLMVSLYGLLMWRGLVIARRAPDQLGSLLAAGLSLWIVLEAFVNMAVMLGLLPFAGNALPFVSAGGSNLLVSLAAIGILMNISRMSTHKEDEIGKALRAVVDLRGRQRRRRVSRPRSAPGVER